MWSWQVDLPRLPLSGSPHAPAEQPAGKQWLRQLASKAPLPGRQVITGALLLGAVCVAASVTRRAEPTLTSDGNSTAVYAPFLASQLLIIGKPTWD